MTTENQQTHTEHKQPIPFGSRLKSAREALGLERKDAAAHLRLNEKFIIMMEKDRYPSDLPITFIRGYIRAYGKFLQIPEYEIKKAIEPIKPKPGAHDGAAPVAKPAPMPVTSSHYFVQLITYAVVLTMIGLVGMWWYSHVTTTNKADLTTDQFSLQPSETTNSGAASVSSPPALPNALSTAATPPAATAATANTNPQAATNEASPSPTAPSSEQKADNGNQTPKANTQATDNSDNQETDTTDSNSNNTETNSDDNAD